MLVFAAILVIAPLRDFFELAPLGLPDVAILATVVCAWTVGVRWTWRGRLLDRLISRG